MDTNVTMMELLQKHGGNENVLQKLEDYGVREVKDLLQLSENHLIDAGMKLVPAKYLLDEVRGMLGSSEGEDEVVGPIKEIMEIPLDDDSLLEQIKLKHELRLGEQSYIAAIRADLADRAGLMDALENLGKQVEQYAVDNDMPVDNVYFEVQKLKAQRNYADIFAALPNGGRNAITATRKQQMLERMRQYFWPAVFKAYLEMLHWQDLWNKSLTPAAALAIIANKPGMMPPGAGVAPDAGPLRDAAEKLNEAINKALSGLNSMAADALLVDCMRVKEILMKEGLPEKIGATDYDQMLKKLGVTVDASVVRTEKSLVQFVLGLINSKDIEKEDEAAYFSALCMVGSQINWQLIGFRADELEALKKEVVDLNVILPEPLVLGAKGSPQQALTAKNGLVGIPRLEDRD